MTAGRRVGGWRYRVSVRRSFGQECSNMHSVAAGAMQMEIDEEKRVSILVEGRRVLRAEAHVLRAIHLDEDFAAAVYLIWRTKGKVFTTGMGKSGLVAQRVAATLTVSGTPAHFLHPTDALHGDIGALQKEDLLLVVSRSGEGDELLQVAAYAQHLDLPIVVITAFPHAPLAVVADAVLVHGGEEACPYGVTPTSSITAAGAIGDALAMALQKQRGETRESFAERHQAGNLGRRLMLEVKDVMVTGEDVGYVAPKDTVLQAMVMLARKRGTVVVQNTVDREILGVVTAGDVARYLDARTITGSSYPLLMEGWEQDPVDNVMTRHPYVVGEQVLVHEAIAVMERRGVMALPVIQKERDVNVDTGEVLREATLVVGMIHLHDALRARVQ